MLQYIVILLDNASTSYCHYANTKKEKHLISLSNLKSGILFAMKHNLMIQFVYPEYELTEAYLNIIEMIDHHKIVPQKSKINDADVVVFDGCTCLEKEVIPLHKGKIFVIRTDKTDFFAHHEKIALLLGKTERVNVVLTDMETFTQAEFSLYEKCLGQLQKTIKEVCLKGSFPQFNLLSDRIMLDKMNNCNAGYENITLAPNGKFYICPAFYIENEDEDIGSLTTGLEIRNKQLYQLQYAPLCRTCDAYQCKRCVWLNRKATREVNTPSHEQCVVAHLERNASENLLRELKQTGYFSDREIPVINYLDPFEIIKKT